MKKLRIQAKVEDLVLNEGQLDWLPRNPRQWTQTDIDRTKRSLERDPDFQEDNPLKVVPLPDGRLLVFAGNLRTVSARLLQWDTFEAMKYEPENEDDRATIIRRAMLDNGSFGSWDVDRLANEWEAAAEAQGFTLPDWGAPEWASKPKEEKGLLPQELQGINLEPDPLPKEQGTDETAFERVIICYRKEDEPRLAELLGLETIEKVVYKLDGESLK